ncbi:MAG: SUMF1/EgtB/PvdO family nonheme iron enzyme, partial [bacterium]|nr:SUMF1/EgtB/PvdO family nonheme iron enzyme [bacterium]
EFVDAGGYERREYWRYPIVQGEVTVRWEQAMKAFVDSTGRSGPATWRLGSYPEREAGHPVRGVSWYEAAAYAAFAGKSLPTIFHWENAAGLGFFSEILGFSSIGGEGPVAAGSREGIGPYGTYDMAGNVKEWCWNAVGDRRYIRGGAWNEPHYLFRLRDAHAPIQREINYGFRCVRYALPAAAELLEPVPRVRSEANDTLKPVSDEQFEIIRGFFAYDQTDLNARVENVDDTSPLWRRERITFDAAYGGERVIAILFLPKN